MLLANVLEAFFHKSEAGLPFKPARAPSGKVGVVANEFMSLASPCLRHIGQIEHQVTWQSADDPRFGLFRHHATDLHLVLQSGFMHGIFAKSRYYVWRTCVVLWETSVDSAW